MDVFVKWFIRLWLTALTVSAFLWLWKHFPVGLLLLALLIIFICQLLLRERWRRQRQGYWLEYLSPGQLRVGEDDFAIVYHEEKSQHFFQGKVGRHAAPDVLTVPSVNEWETHTPAWMHEKRDAILQQIQVKFSRVQIVETE